MSIITQNNSVLKCISGEVYKQPPLIDISSSYGVTKDGSNLVSSVKNRYHAKRFRGVAGKYPIENGNGFEFTNDLLIKERDDFDWSKDYTIEFWIKPSNSTGQHMFMSVVDTGFGTPYFQMYLQLLNSVFTLATLNSTITSGSQLFNYSKALTINSWNHIIVSFKKGFSESIYIDGVANYAVELRDYTLTGILNKNIYIGQYYNGVSAFSGSFDKLKVINESSPAFQNYNGSTFKVAGGALAFTPPTYPNTLL